MAKESEAVSESPKHLACVMDGNGRWAQKRGFERTEGHRNAKEAVAEIVQGAIDNKIEWLTLFAFSTENWKRPPAEVNYLIGPLLNSQFSKWAEKAMKAGVRFRFVGHSLDQLSKKSRKTVEDVVVRSSNNSVINVTFAFDYGSRLEIVDAVKKVIDAGLTADEVDEATISRFLYEPEMPDVDLWLRTAGDQRMSNFLLWQSAYAELVFVDTLWPDFEKKDLESALVEYKRRERRFGALPQETSDDAQSGAVDSGVEGG